MTSRKEKNEAAVKTEVLDTLGRDPAFMVWNHPTGVGRALTPPYSFIRYGKPGSSDVIGVALITVTPDMVGKKIGVAIGVETKHPTRGDQREKQKNFQAAFERRGGIYILTRTAEGVKEAIYAALRRRYE